MRGRKAAEAKLSHQPHSWREPSQKRKPSSVEKFSGEPLNLEQGGDCENLEPGGNLREGEQLVNFQQQQQQYRGQGVGGGSMFLLRLPNVLAHLSAPSRDSTSLPTLLDAKAQRKLQAGAPLQVSPMWKDLQEEQHSVHPLAHPLRHPALPLLILWQKVPPEVRHEETHLYSHRREAAQVHRVFEVFLAEQQLDHTHAQAHGLQAVRLRAL